MYATPSSFHSPFCAPPSHLRSAVSHHARRADIEIKSVSNAAERRSAYRQAAVTVHLPAVPSTLRKSFCSRQSLHALCGACSSQSSATFKPPPECTTASQADTSNKQRRSAAAACRGLSARHAGVCWTLRSRGTSCVTTAACGQPMKVSRFPIFDWAASRLL